MHRQFSQSTIWSLRLGSLHFIANICAISLGMALLIMGVATRSDIYTLSGFITLAVGVLSILLFKICSSAMTCPVCVSRIWANTGCRKHKKSKKALKISYRLNVAFKILTLQPYRCPYCAERFSSTSSIR
jgi:uncharacterized CHY-type Zn-finger protein